MRQSTCHSLTHEEILENLRLAFQSRVAEEEFTLTEAEAEHCLSLAPVSSLLQSFNSLGYWLKQEKAQRLMWYDQDEVVNVLLPKFIAKVGKRNDITAHL